EGCAFRRIRLAQIAVLRADGRGAEDALAAGCRSHGSSGPAQHMIFLFVHQNFPGQYKHLVRYLADQPGNTVYFVSQPNDNWMRGVRKIIYRADRPSGLNCHPYTMEYDVAVRVGLAVAAVCRDLRNRGVVPDVMIGHCGWGETLFIKDVFPNTPLL